ncbi:isochorismatase [Bacteroidia bacterium]|nr:isochorismatase [Bacteroidia bacterium]GHU69972.1 isochorismatase [Bacteroidia bacterium]
MKVLIIIDMLNGFCREGYPLSLPNYNPEIETYIKKQIEEYQSNNDKVIFICDSHKLSDPEINDPYPPHCMDGTPEAEIIDTLSNYKKNALILHKHTLSIMYQTGLESILQELNPDKIELVGVCTDICDLFAVYELRIRGYKVAVLKQGVLPFNPDKQEEFLNYFETKLSAEIY